MNSYIALLRGVNVNGSNIIPMKDLRLILEKIKFKNVKTYIQSGNIVFQTDLNDVKAIEQLIEKTIQKKFEITVPVLVLDQRKLENYIQKNPFINHPNTGNVYYTFLFEKSQLKSKELNDLLKPFQNGEEEFLILNDMVYVYCANGYGKTKLHNKLIEQKFKITATTRNFKTTHHLLEMLKELN